VSLYLIHLKMVVVRFLIVFIYLINNGYCLIHATNIKCSSHDSYICLCSSHKNSEIYVFYSVFKNCGFILFFSVKERYLELNIVPPGKNVLYFPFEWQAMCPLVECKFSLVIKDKQIKVSRLH
jgi:hypothetical protein